MKSYFVLYSKIINNSALIWKNKVLRCKKKTQKYDSKNKKKYMKSKIRLIAFMCLVINAPKERKVWMHPRSDAWSRMV